MEALVWLGLGFVGGCIFWAFTHKAKPTPVVNTGPVPPGSGP